MNHTLRLTAQKIAGRLELVAGRVVRRAVGLRPWRFQAATPQPDPRLLDPALDDSGWPEIRPRTYWGAQALNFVLRGEFAVPPEFDPGRPVALFLPLGVPGDFAHPEALVYVDGQAYATVDRYHQEVPLAEALRDGRRRHLALHGWTGHLGSPFQPDPGRQLFLEPSAVIEIDPPTREFVAAARTALLAAGYLGQDEPARARLYNALDEAFRLLDTREPFGDDFYASVPAALDRLRQGIAQAGPPLDVEVIAAGHAHIDVAWLWTLDQTRQKARRTFYTALGLMDQFPDFSFTQSQPQLYDYIRQDDPALFQAIQGRVADGRWEPIGGMWVEADCNLSGAESLVRQLVLGRAFFRRHFGPGAESPVLWLPDVFGYAWCLPQLIRQAGLEYFFTIKIGWNQVNKLPFDSFWWQGLDGTRVLTHFSTSPTMAMSGEPNLRAVATYNADLNAFTVLGSWVKLQHKEAQRTLLMSYGYGDGGGGPTREMNENARELAAFPALPRVRQGRVIDFFRQLETESGDRLPVWNSELYLEIHRGTYTTQGRNKRANRQSEFLLHDAEFVCALAALLDPAFAYPHDDLRWAWELVCLNQFHDILPGSSIHEVYVESQQQYAEVRALGEAARDAGLAVIWRAVGGDVLLVNPAGFARRDPALWPGRLPAGQRFVGPVFTQPVEGGTLIDTALEPFEVRPLRFAPGEPAQPDPERFRLHAEPGRLENAFLRVELDAAGEIRRIYDKVARREIVPPGAIANQFQAFEDRPVDWDAWDIDVFYDDKLFLAEPAESVRVVETGPLRATLEIRRRLLHSQITQRLSLAWNHPQLTFDTAVDWRERHILLKVAFPVEILSPVATFEIQWGSVQRPTHRNTSWDWARFETCAQKWVDLSEGGYGVALLNNGKYGHDIHDHVIRLSLLRSPTQPDPEADQGQHHFTYSLLPHANPAGGLLVPSAIAGPAYALNDPILVVAERRKDEGPHPPTPSPVRADATGEGGIDSDFPSPVRPYRTGEGAGGEGLSSFREPLVRLPDGVIVETIKQAEDGRGVIVRLYECNRQRGLVTVQADFPLQEAYRTNLLEENAEQLEVEGHTVRLYVRPFEIVTLRLVV